MPDSATDRSLHARRLEALTALLRLPLGTSERDALLVGIDAAVELTGSRIGYLHYLNDDQVTIELSTWSTHTADYCTAAFDRHYPVDAAGIWADTARTRTPQVHNDYPTATGRRGLPEGHSPLLRHLGVAATSAEGRVRLILGVGNKPAAYADDDVRSAQLVVDETWRVIERLRAHEAVLRDLALLRSRQESAGLATWEWDPELGTVTWDEQVDRLVGPAPPTVAESSWDRLLSRLDDPSRAKLARALDSGPDAPPLDVEVRGSRPDGVSLTLLLQGEWVPRQQGLGHVVRGSLLDVRLQEEAARARYRAQHDALTGLPNRAWLLDEVTRLLSGDTPDDSRGGSGASVATHLVSLVGLREVNEDFGHLVGDDVLLTCADRLSALARGGVVACRLGGDEFAVLQRSPVDAAAATRLAQRIVTALNRPIDAAGVSVRLDACVGVALGHGAAAGSGGPGEDARALLARADRARVEARGSADPIRVDGG